MPAFFAKMREEWLRYAAGGCKGRLRTIKNKNPVWEMPLPPIARLRVVFPVRDCGEGATMRVGSLLVLCGLLGLASGAAEAKTQEFEAGSWFGAAQYNDASGAFELCYISGEYQSRISVFFQIDYDGGFHIAFEHPDWRLKVGEAYPVMLEVDSALSESYRAVAYTETGVDIGFETAGGLLDILRYGQEMRVRTERDSFTFLLTGTKAALTQLQDCYDRNGRMKTAANPAAGGDSSNPFGAPLGKEASSTAAAPGDNDTFRHNAVAIFEQIFTDKQLARFKLLHGTDIPNWLRDSDLVWVTGSTYGSLRADLGEVTPAEASSYIAADDAKNCKGEVASATVNSELKNGHIVRRVAVSCIEDDRAVYTYYSIYPTVDPAGSWIISHLSMTDRNGAKAADQAIFDLIDSLLGERS
jgi:hypothetical protein